MKTKDLRALILKAYARQMERADGLKGSDNPQTIASYHESKTTAEVLAIVAEAIDAPRPGAAYLLQLLAS